MWKRLPLLVPSRAPPLGFGVLSTFPASFSGRRPLTRPGSFVALSFLPEPRCFSSSAPTLPDAPTEVEALNLRKQRARGRWRWVGLSMVKAFLLGGGIAGILHLAFNKDDDEALLVDWLLNGRYEATTGEVLDAALFPETVGLRRHLQRAKLRLLLSLAEASPSIKDQLLRRALSKRAQRSVPTDLPKSEGGFIGPGTSELALFQNELDALLDDYLLELVWRAPDSYRSTIVEHGGANFLCSLLLAHYQKANEASLEVSDEKLSRVASAFIYLSTNSREIAASAVEMFGLRVLADVLLWTDDNGTTLPDQRLQHYLRTATHVLLDCSKETQAESRLDLCSSLQVVARSVASSGDATALKLLSEAISNFSAGERLSSSRSVELQEGLLNGLKALRDSLVAEELEVQIKVSKALASLSKGRWAKRAIASEWGDSLFHWVMSPSFQLSRNAIIVFNNLVAEPAVAVPFLASQAGAKMISGIAYVVEAADEGARQQLGQYICSSLANISKIAADEQTQDLALHVFEALAVVFNNYSKESSSIAAKYLARSLSGFTKSSSIAQLIAHPDRWQWVLTLSKAESIDTKRHMARTVGNVAAAVVDTHCLRGLSQLRDMLDEWERSSDVILHYEAVRALGSLLDPSVERYHIKYADGIYLLYPPPTSATSRSAKFDFDAVLLHGVTGNPFGTWVLSPPGAGENEQSLQSITESEHEPEASSTVWPRDWLPRDFPRVRVLTVGYEMELSRWLGNALPIKTRAKEILEKLRMASLGSRPIVFIGHSFGGLLVKEILLESLRQGDSRIVDQTAGLIFFATPHKGAQLVRLAKKAMFFRGTPAVDDLSPESESMAEINSSFATLVSQHKWPTLSFGELEKTCVVDTSLAKLCFFVVELDSANPSFDVDTNQTNPKEERIFIPVAANHRAICKPSSRSDVRYSAVRDFIAKLGLKKDPRS